MINANYSLVTAQIHQFINCLTKESQLAIAERPCKYAETEKQSSFVYSFETFSRRNSNNTSSPHYFNTKSIKIYGIYFFHYPSKNVVDWSLTRRLTFCAILNTSSTTDKRVIQHYFQISPQSIGYKDFKKV